MLHLWKPENIKFMYDASENTSYNKEIANVIRTYINSDMNIADFGAGLGYIDFELRDCVKKITLIEINKDAVDKERELINQKGINNIETVNMDGFDYVCDNKFDAGVFSFFGHIEDVLKLAVKNVDGKVFVVTRNYTNHRFSKNHESFKWGGGDATISYLKDFGINPKRFDLSLEFGQPFRDLSEAFSFFKLYSRNEDTSYIDENFLKDRVIDRNNKDFPFNIPEKFNYYMPSIREIAIIVFDTKEIKHALNI